MARKERKQGIKGNMRREESKDLAKRGFVHMNHSRETLDSGPGRSVQFVYVFLWVCGATLKNVLYMWTKCLTCTTYLKGTWGQTHSVATTVKWSARETTGRTRAYRCVLAEKSSFSVLFSHTKTHTALPCCLLSTLFPSPFLLPAPLPLVPPLLQVLPLLVCVCVCVSRAVIVVY